MVSYHFSIAPNRAAIHTILDDLHDIHHHHKNTFELSDILLFRLSLIADETLTNIISYGLTDQSCPCITMDITIKQKKIYVVIKDNGFYFNPLAFTALEKEKKLENIPIGKIGIQFVKTFSRNIKYHRKDDFNYLSFECSDTVM